MGLTNSPGLARLVLIELSKKFAKEYPKANDVLCNDTYMDDSNVLGETINDVIQKANEVIHCLDKGSFRAGKILTDSKAIIQAMPEDSLHPALKEAIDNNRLLVHGTIGESVKFEHPNVQSAIVNDAKQLGIHFTINLKKEESHLTYHHWSQGNNNTKLTKREVARSFAKAWNPLHELGPITNPGKF